MSEFSQSRLEHRIMEAIGQLIVSGAIKNPHLSPFTSVTRVELSPDNASATVFVSAVPDNRIDPSVKALESAKGFIQSRIAAILKTRNTPVLTFRRDDSYREAERVNRLIDEALGR
ncbi:MAG: 30S ribosome-binding factor RbfA [Spirochaetes bacterium]|uniref:Ribosome-binding factor A n=1 Tax=Candidatus Ornithospirochaeta stercoripullorum TaxID=2840899 RepID=A0A9D9E059_9SPIO|nr:30S ribosome-binding factor RbfA [Candidatus Ornithospirochaeta stercoripullorum]